MPLTQYFHIKYFVLFENDVSSFLSSVVLVGNKIILDTLIAVLIVLNDIHLLESAFLQPLLDAIIIVFFSEWKKVMDLEYFLYTTVKLFELISTMYFVE